MSRIKQQFCITLGLFLLTAVGSFSSGCRPQPRPPEGMPPLTQCIVAVTFGGEKIEHVGVRLRPKETGNRWGAGGLTDAEGKAVLKTAGPFEGAVPGEYIISFEKKVSPPAAEHMTAPRTSLIPAKYDASQSKETITITAEQKEYVFELERLK
ncbi:MAG: hypothetical protein LBT46_14515 [Planctomycetaceae bacterium]|nr:hypothetical protein [Planctomycetaceae bacterium]